MIEALIVISIMILGLLGLVFLRQYYLKQIHASRLARAGVLAYAMMGCDDRKPPLLPRDWIGVKDLAKLSPESQGPPNNQQVQNNTGQTVPGGTNDGKKAFGASGALDPQDGIMNPIAQTGMFGEASVTKEGTSAVGTPPKFFKKTARSRAFASCGDEIRDGSFSEVLGKVMGLFWPF